MDEKIEEMYQEFLCYKFKTKAEDFSYKGMCENFYQKGYRKESDTAKEICDLILEHWEKKQFVECDWLRVAIAEKYGVDLGE